MTFFSLCIAYFNWIWVINVVGQLKKNCRPLNYFVFQIYAYINHLRGQWKSQHLISYSEQSQSASDLRVRRYKSKVGSAILSLEFTLLVYMYVGKYVRNSTMSKCCDRKISPRFLQPTNHFARSIYLWVCIKSATTCAFIFTYPLSCHQQLCTHIYNYEHKHLLGSAFSKVWVWSICQ